MSVTAHVKVSAAWAANDQQLRAKAGGRKVLSGKGWGVCLLEIGLVLPRHPSSKQGHRLGPVEWSSIVLRGVDGEE